MAKRLPSTATLAAQEPAKTPAELIVQARQAASRIEDQGLGGMTRRNMRETGDLLRELANALAQTTRMLDWWERKAAHGCIDAPCRICEPELFDGRED